MIKLNISEEIFKYLSDELKEILSKTPKNLFENVEEMNKYFLDAWNAKIKSDDTVYILGDLHIRGKNEDLIDIVSKFNGKKVLIKGNHDNVSDANYSGLFEEICDYKELTEKVNLILSIKYSEEKTPDTWVDVDLNTREFNVSANGKYTVKVETVLGATAQDVITITEIDKVAPTLENLLAS